MIKSNISILKYTQYVLIISSICAFSLLKADKMPQARSYYQKAQQLIKEYNYFEATELLRKALNENPYYTDAKILLADSYFMLRNYSTAWELYVDVEKTRPDDTSLLIRLAKTKISMATNSNDITGAIYYLNKAYRIEPRNPDVIATYGAYYYAIGNLKKAMEYYNQLGSNPNNVSIHLNKAKVYEQWADNTSRLKELKNAESLDSNNYTVLVELAKYYSGNQLYVSAIEYLTMAQKINPYSVDVLLLFAQLYMNQKDFQSAIPYLSQILVKDKTNSLLYYYMAVAYEALGDYPKSLDVLKTGLEYDYGNEFLRVKAEEIGVKHFSLGNAEREKLSLYYSHSLPSVATNALNINTIFFLNRSIRLNPLSLSTRIKLAQIYRQKGYIYEYLKIMRTGLLLEPQNEKIKNEIKLNKRFALSTLEAKENIPPFFPVETKPVYVIGDVIINSSSTYLYFGSEFKQLLLEALLATKRINAFIQDQSDNNKIPDFEIRLIINPNQNKISLKAELIYLKTGAVFQTYHINEYGNNKLYNSVLLLSSKLAESSPMIGKVVKMQGNTAIINIGSMQGVERGDNVFVLKSNSSSTLFNIKKLSLNQQNELSLASGNVVELGENISKITFIPLKSVVFNLVQPNQDILVIKKERK